MCCTPTSYSRSCDVTLHSVVLSPNCLTWGLLVVGAILINLDQSDPGSHGGQNTLTHKQLWEEKGGVVSNGADDRFKI